MGTKIEGLEVFMAAEVGHFFPKNVAANSPDAVGAIEGDRTDNVN